MPKRYDYTQIEEPYNSLMERQTQEFGTAPIFKALQDVVADSLRPNQNFSSDSSSSGLDRNDTLLSTGEIQNLVNYYLKGFLQTENYSPRTLGFKLDALTGTVDFSNAYIAKLNLGFAPKAIPFHDSTRLTYDLNDLNWDSSLKRLGINTNTPLFTAHVNGTLGYKRPLNPQTSNYSVLAVDSNTFFTNEGAVAGINFSLPATAAGLTYTFYVQTGQTLLITAPGGSTIRNGTTISDSGGFLHAGAIGSSIRLVAINATEWVTEAVIGSWAIVWETSIFDTITLSESVSIFIASLSSLFDAITVSEAVTMELNNNFSVNDTVTITEDVTLSVV